MIDSTNSRKKWPPQDFMPNLTSPDQAAYYAHYNKNAAKPRIEDELLSVIRTHKDSRLKATKKMAKLLIRDKEVQNYKLARYLKPKLNNRNIKIRIRKSDYNSEKKKDYDKQIRHRLKFLNRVWQPFWYRVAFHSEYTELIEP